MAAGECLISEFLANKLLSYVNLMKINHGI